MQSKICKDCGEEKPLELFCKPVPTYCKVCAARRNKAWRDQQRAIVLAALGPVIPKTEKPCKRCGIVKPLADYYLQGGARSSYCKPCCTIRNAEKRILNPGIREKEQLRYKTKRMGTTPEWFNEKLASQNGVCAICKQPETHPIKRGSSTVRSLAIDHDHITGKVRGLLCFRCNTSVHLLDKFGAEWLRSAARYLNI